MPGFNGTGPNGFGPMTGGGRGFCAMPAGRGRQFYRGRNIGRAAQFPFQPDSGVDIPGVQATASRDETASMKEMLESISQSLLKIEKRIDKLENQ